MSQGEVPFVYGAAYSVYVRAVRLALAEKGVAYRLVEVDVFGEGGVPAEHLVRHPFGRIPAFAHGDFRLYESSAIERYVDEAFDGPALQPSGLRERARMNQIISMLDSYAYRTLVWDIFVERVRAPEQDRKPDEAKIQEALPRARACLTALEGLMGDGPWLAGASFSLADTHAAPMFAYFMKAEESDAVMAGQPKLRAWWSRMAARPSMAETRSPLERHDAA